MKPKTIVQFWNTPDLPEDISKLVATWKDQNPSMEHKLFSYDSALQFIAEHYGLEIRNLFESAALPAMQSDIFRVAYCLKMGGFYIDCGTRCNASIEPLLSDDLLFLVRKWHGGIWNGAIGCNAGDPALKWIWDRIIQNLKARNSNDVWKLTGPLSFNQMVESKAFDNSINVVEQPSTKPFFDIVNELEHKKKHWSIEQQKRGVFTDQPYNKGLGEEREQFNAEIKLMEYDTESPLSCRATIIGGFDKNNVSRVILKMSGVLLSTGISKDFSLILNRRNSRTEIEFYPPKVNRHLPLQQFIKSGYNGVTDYMLLMPEKVESNVFYQLSKRDRHDLNEIIGQTIKALDDVEIPPINDFKLGSINRWKDLLKKVFDEFYKINTLDDSSYLESPKASIKIRKVILDQEKIDKDVTMLFHGEATLDSNIQFSFKVALCADLDLSTVIHSTLYCQEVMVNKVAFLQAFASSIHKLNLNGKSIGYSVEKWFYALNSHIAKLDK